MIIFNVPSSQNLQSVTEKGNTTTKEIFLKDVNGIDLIKFKQIFAGFQYSPEINLLESANANSTLLIRGNGQIIAKNWLIYNGSDINNSIGSVDLRTNSTSNSKVIFFPDYDGNTLLFSQFFTFGTTLTAQNSVIVTLPIQELNINYTVLLIPKNINSINFFIDNITINNFQLNFSIAITGSIEYDIYIIKI